MRLLSCAVAALLSLPAAAAPVTGELSLNGSDTFTASSTAFQINFLNPANIGGTSGSFAAVFGAVPPAVDGVVTMIATLSDTSTNFELYSAAVGANTTTLTAGTISGFVFGTVAGGLSSLAVSGAGTLNLTGFDPTPGFFDLTTQGADGINVTFSSTQVPVPTGVREPAGTALLLAGLGALALARSSRRRGPRPPR